MSKILIAGCLFTFIIAGCTKGAAIPAAIAPVRPTEAPARIPTPTVELNQNPPPCWEAELIYHTRIKKMILVNCVMDPTKATLLTIWSWDGTQWQKLAQDGPPGRILGGAAYDDLRDVLVLYGGRAVEVGSAARRPGNGMANSGNKSMPSLPRLAITSGWSMTPLSRGLSFSAAWIHPKTSSMRHGRGTVRNGNCSAKMVPQAAVILALSMTRATDRLSYMVVLQATFPMNSGCGKITLGNRWIFRDPEPSPISV